MNTLLAQMTLSLHLKDEATFDNFYPGPHQEVIAALQKAASYQEGRIIFLFGRTGMGCSHLLQATCHYAHQHQYSSVYLPLSQLIVFSPAVLEGLESLQVVCFDDIQRIAGLREWEEAIFHLFNRLYDTGGTIIFAANDLPSMLPILLPDLKSRLTWGVTYALHPLNDEEKLAMLKMRAMRRGLHLPEDVGKYILRHCPRHMNTLLAALDTLDNASLAAKRRLTIPFVKEVLQI